MACEYRLTDVRFKLFFTTHASVLVISALALIVLSRDARLDFAMARLFYDTATNSFYLRDNRWLEAVGHDGLKWFVLIIWLGALALAVASLSVKRLRAARADLWWFCIAAAAVALLVSWLKSQNAHACPWDLDAFGGHKLWYALLDTPPASQPGRCWPGGHASGGFALVAGYFAWRDSRRSLARFWLVLGLGLGAIMSAVQIARGAHFLSHNLWTLWWSWLVCLALYALRCAYDAKHLR